MKNAKCKREEIKIANENGIDGDEKNGNNRMAETFEYEKEFC